MGLSEITSALLDRVGKGDASELHGPEWARLVSVVADVERDVAEAPPLGEAGRPQGVTSGVEGGQSGQSTFGLSEAQRRRLGLPPSSQSALHRATRALEPAGVTSDNVGNPGVTSGGGDTRPARGSGGSDLPRAPGPMHAWSDALAQGTTSQGTRSQAPSRPAPRASSGTAGAQGPEDATVPRGEGRGSSPAGKHPAPAGIINIDTAIDDMEAEGRRQAAGHAAGLPAPASSTTPRVEVPQTPARPESLQHRAPSRPTDPQPAPPSPPMDHPRYDPGSSSGSAEEQQG